MNNGFELWEWRFIEVAMIFFVLVVGGLVLCTVWTKTDMCKDFGEKMYGQELTWFQCLVL